MLRFSPMSMSAYADRVSPPERTKYVRLRRNRLSAGTDTGRVRQRGHIIKIRTQIKYGKKVTSTPSRRMASIRQSPEFERGRKSEKEK